MKFPAFELEQQGEEEEIIIWLLFILKLFDDNKKSKCVHKIYENDSIKLIYTFYILYINILLYTNIIIPIYL